LLRTHKYRTTGAWTNRYAKCADAVEHSDRWKEQGHQTDLLWRTFELGCTRYANSPLHLIYYVLIITLIQRNW